MLPGSNVAFVNAMAHVAVTEGLHDETFLREHCEDVDDYLAFIAKHPKVFFMLVEHRTSDDPLRDGKEVIAGALARNVGDFLRQLGLDSAGAEPWAHGVVGLGLAHGEWWLRRRTMSRTAAATYLADFVWNAFEGIARESGVDLDVLTRPTPLRVAKDKQA